MKIAVTGTTGYLGGQVALHLHANNFEVHSIDRGASDATVSGRHQLNTKSYKDLSRTIETISPQIVIHVAGLYVRRASTEDVGALIEANVAYPARLIEAARCAGVSTFISATSYHAIQSRRSPSLPTLYASSKASFGIIASWYAAKTDLRVVELVLYDTYGPGDTRDKFIPQLLGATKRGKPKIDLPESDRSLPLVHVRDVARAFSHACRMSEDLDPSKRWIYAVRPAHVETLESVIATVETLGGYSIERRWNAFKSETVGDRSSEIPTLPGWSETLTLQSGLRDLLHDT